MIVSGGIWIFFATMLFPTATPHEEHIFPFTAEDESYFSPEQRLIHDKISKYIKNVRPKLNPSEPILLRMDIALSHILELDEKRQVLRTLIWSRQYWRDDLLKWDPEQYDGIKRINVAADKIWTPDIVLWNSASDDFGFEKTTLVIADFDGNITWLTPKLCNSQCDIDIRFFPFDNQHCSLTFGSWTYSGADIDILNIRSTMDVSIYNENGEYDLTGTSVIRHIDRYDCCKEPYLSLEFVMHITRRPRFYIYNVILPCMIIVATMSLQFFLPVESGEKITFGTAVLLSLFVFTTMIVNILPANSNTTPIASEFFIVMMMMSGISIIISVFILRSHYKRRSQARHGQSRRTDQTRKQRHSIRLVENPKFQSTDIQYIQNKEVKGLTFQPIKSSAQSNLENDANDVNQNEAANDVTFQRPLAFSKLQRLEMMLASIYIVTFFVYIVSVLVRFSLENT